MTCGLHRCVCCTGTGKGAFRGYDRRVAQAGGEARRGGHIPRTVAACDGAGVYGRSRHGACPYRHGEDDGPMTNDPVQSLRARLDEEADLARSCDGDGCGEWTAPGGTVDFCRIDLSGFPPVIARHIAVHDPARVLLGLTGPGGPGGRRWSRGRGPGYHWRSGVSRAGICLF
ncbi:DUF6221 family protein [Streptomyces sp. NPDC057486]|uniref:DUF6221 family protein n=1 Tax=Streptomyces sp. NPDC057486 TaxID=3346145 RepID=UPI0036A35C16